MNPATRCAPKILVFDSGLGGLTVLREIARERPDAALIYAADDAVFPYGDLAPDALIARVDQLMEIFINDHAPDAVVIACNTASTLVLPGLRARWPKVPFVGTVPAVKPAAERSCSHMISVLATPGTVARDYTRDLIETHAAHCTVNLVGSRSLARLAEQAMRGERVDDAAIAQEIAPCFVEAENGSRTDAIVLACTHYPLLIEQLVALAPWPVEWIDPAPAIARRADHVVREQFPLRADAAAPPGVAIFTSGKVVSTELAIALRRFGLDPLRSAP